MQWEPPLFLEIDMNAEIGAYQQDPGDGADPDRIVPDGAAAEAPPAGAEESPARGT